MSTRTAKDDSVFYQNRYASSPEFERGLLANLVAKRCSIIDDQATRELIWFLQYLSHQTGGLVAVAGALVKNYSHRMGTAAMVAAGKKAGDNYNTIEVQAVRKELPRSIRKEFRLRDEPGGAWKSCSDLLNDKANRARELYDYAYAALDNYEENESARAIKAQQEKEAERLEAKIFPDKYPVAKFLEWCCQCAVKGHEEWGVRGYKVDSLEKVLADLCLNPESCLTTGPFYFADLVATLREYHRQWIEDKSHTVVTTLGKKVHDVLDYTLASRSLSLMEGNARLGKSFAAGSWCLQHPERARLVEVPASNDDAAFFRALARSLGLGNFLKYKVADIRERVESVLLTGDLLLVLDESQRLWPQRNLRYGFPSRIVWVMTMANAGVPICMISTPQFILTQKAVEKSGWNSAQLTGRIGHYEFLPVKLDESDLIAVGHALLPEVTEKVLQILADYASTSARYLAAIDSIAKRARYIAHRAGRSHCKTEDVRTAMNESVIPSDAMLVCTLERAKKAPARGRPPLTVEHSPETALPTMTAAALRETTPAPAKASRIGRLVITPGALMED